MLEGLVTDPLHRMATPMDRSDPRTSTLVVAGPPAQGRLTDAPASTTALLGAIQEARAAYVADVARGRAAAKAGFARIRLAIEEVVAPQRAATLSAVAAVTVARLAQDDTSAAQVRLAAAWAAYQDAFGRAKAGQQAAIDTSAAAYLRSVADTRSRYGAAIRSAYATYAPGAALPRWLVDDQPPAAVVPEIELDDSMVGTVRRAQARGSSQVSSHGSGPSTSTPAPGGGLPHS